MVKKQRGIKLDELVIVPVWSDSMGAKSFSVFIDTGDIRVIIDPGASIMHSSFPLSNEEKFYYLELAHNTLKRYMIKSDLIIITHYHYDHFYHRDLKIYKGRDILAKNPNQYINESQRERALEFYSSLLNDLMGVRIELVKRERDIQVKDPLRELVIASNKDFGDYSSRRKYLIEKGRRWFFNLVKKWSEWKVIPEIKSENIRISFVDNRTFTFGQTRIHFYKPLFHGVEFSRLGWVIPVIIEKNGFKILYTSDINGPIIEDYAEWIISENPDILFIDGPATYMIPYTMNIINFRRAKENLIKIIDNIDAQYIFLDHHLTRDLRYRIRLKDIYSKKKPLMTFAEFYEKKSLAHKLYENKYGKSGK